MAGSESVLLEIGEKINSLQKDMSQKWHSKPRTVFVNALEKSVEDTRGLKGMFSKLAADLEKDPKPGMPDLKPFMKELDKILGVLEKNLRFEREKKSRAKTVNVLEREETPELYADLEQKILGLLLKARYSLERAGIFMRKQGFTPITEKSTAKQVMEVLGRREDELQSLREKYSGLRKKSYLGYFEEESAADLEQKLFDLGKKMALSADDLSKSISLHRSQIDYIGNSYVGLKQKLDMLEEIFSAYSEKSEELIKSLKKERDYAKKVVLEVENETLQLRNTYSKELLNLQENKLAAKKEAEARFEAELKKLRKQLDQQDDLVKHFKRIAEEKLRKEHDLEEKVRHLTLLLKTKEKHDGVKKRFKAKRKRAKKKKE